MVEMLYIKELINKMKNAVHALKGERGRGGRVVVSKKIQLFFGFSHFEIILVE